MTCSSPGPTSKSGTAPRVEFVLMQEQFIDALLDGADGGDERFGGVLPWPGWPPPDDGWLRMRRTQARSMPELAAWLPWAVVRRRDRQMIGHIGFHSAPGPIYLRDIAPGGIEIGYTIFAPFRGHGYATEAAEILIDWAYREHGIRDFVASISRGNTASQRVVAKLGFTFFREFDENDSEREDVYLLRVAGDG